MTSDQREWSLDGARAVLPDVRRRTEHAVLEVEKLVAEREQAPPGSPERQALDERIRQVVERWAHAMEALGAEVKGVWLVDFDNGSGYYCWKWPESELSYFHAYEEGFAGRVRIH